MAAIRRSVWLSASRNCSLTQPDQINKQIGLNNIQQLTSHISMIAKNELPTKTYLKTNPEICQQPTLVFDDAKTLYFCGKLLMLPIKDDIDFGSVSARISGSGRSL